MIGLRSNQKYYRWKQRKLYYICTLLRWSKLRWIILSILFFIFITEFYENRSITYPAFIQITINKFYSNSKEQDNSTNPDHIIILMNDRAPAYNLAVPPDERPFADPDRAQARLLEQLHFFDTCRRDPSTIVVHIGAYLGDFGLYSAACGCTVYMFEVKPEVVRLINSSIRHNSFPSSRLHFIQKIVSDLPSNTTVKYPPGDGSPPIIDDYISVQTIRLDDIKWPSQSIFMLKIDVDGYELNVLRSATKLFAEKRIQHLIFKYHPWLHNRTTQEILMPYVKNELKPKLMYNLYRTDNTIYGPLRLRDIKVFYEQHIKLDLAADIYAAFSDKTLKSSIKSKPYFKNKHVIPE
ncbi:unnamed protein product [Adineta steineri]|uniref:Methyltransferase FkbM domain-containing protein n=1 Tax=Adineta steineri TaxID=433720 RepID=A0A816ACR6_9BILA|nr:unnamed protein product [Adineta steineri]CAF1105450.1 unnamed protein product [Adineta steineri]CAF1105964.1 unnamed protein product [Adineta steineri]CAF1595751.1 unnamed protein product [Adineta steineri]